jgi:hypothetical protein
MSVSTFITAVILCICGYFQMENNFVGKCSCSLVLPRSLLLGKIDKFFSPKLTLSKGWEISIIKITKSNISYLFIHENWYSETPSGKILHLAPLPVFDPIYLLLLHYVFLVTCLIRPLFLGPKDDLLIQVWLYIPVEVFRISAYFMYHVF